MRVQFTKKNPLKTLLKAKNYKSNREQLILFSISDFEISFEALQILSF
jgi:hypothetical protein